MSADLAPAGLCDRCAEPEPAAVIGQDAYGHFGKFCADCAAWTAEEKLLADYEAELEIYSQGLEKRPVTSCRLSIDKGRFEGLESVT